MHEMSITMNIIETAEYYAKLEGAGKVNEIEVEIGIMAGVMEHALKFCFQSATKGTILDGTKLSIIKVPGIGKCIQCNKEISVKTPYEVCPVCHLPLIKIQGDELKLKAINID